VHAKFKPIETRADSACFSRLKPKYDDVLSNVAFNFNLRRYTKAHSEMFCYFGTGAGATSTFVFASSVAHDAGAGTLVVTCATPAGTALTTAFVGISPDGFTAPTAGADFHFHDPVLEAQAGVIVGYCKQALDRCCIFSSSSSSSCPSSSFSSSSSSSSYSSY